MLGEMGELPDIIEAALNHVSHPLPVGRDLQPKPLSAAGGGGTAAVGGRAGWDRGGGGQGGAAARWRLIHSRRPRIVPRRPHLTLPRLGGSDLYCPYGDGLTPERSIPATAGGHVDCSCWPLSGLRSCSTYANLGLAPDDRVRRREEVGRCYGLQSPALPTPDANYRPA